MTEGGHNLPVSLAIQFSMKRTFRKPTEIISLAASNRYKGLTDT